MTNSSLPLLERLDDDVGSWSSSSVTSSSVTSDDRKEMPEDGINNKVELTSVIIENAAVAVAAAAAETEKNLSDDGSFSFSSNDVVNDEAQSKAEARSFFSWPSFSALQNGRLVLLVLAMAYGSLNVSTRLVFARPDPPDASVSSTIQGWFSVLCFIPLLRRQSRRPTDAIVSPSPITDITKINGPAETATQPSFWRFALELALIDFGTQALINMSLMATPGARASFLIQMSVVFTPVVSVLLGNQKVHKQVWLACFVALAGLFVLSQSSDNHEADPQPAGGDLHCWEDSAATNSSSDAADAGVCLSSSSGLPMFSLSFTWGDWGCLLAALCWSFYIYRMSAWAELFDETATQFVKNGVVAVCYTIWMLVSFVQQSFDADNDDGVGNPDAPRGLWNGWKDPVVWIILFYNALGPCTIADVCQQKAQASVPAAETNVILSLEPVFTTLLGFMVLGEIPSLQELGGGLLITIASIIASCGSGPTESPSCSPCSPATSSR